MQFQNVFIDEHVASCIPRPSNLRPLCADKEEQICTKRRKLILRFSLNSIVWGRTQDGVECGRLTRGGPNFKFEKFDNQKEKFGVLWRFARTFFFFGGGGNFCLRSVGGRWISPAPAHLILRQFGHALILHGLFYCSVLLDLCILSFHTENIGSGWSRVSLCSSLFHWSQNSKPDMSASSSPSLPEGRKRQKAICISRSVLGPV